MSEASKTGIGLASFLLSRGPDLPPVHRSGMVGRNDLPPRWRRANLELMPSPTAHSRLHGAQRRADYQTVYELRHLLKTARAVPS